MHAWHTVRTQPQVGKTNVCLRFILNACVSFSSIGMRCPEFHPSSMYTVFNSSWHVTLPYVVIDINIYGRLYSGQNSNYLEKN